jgi:quercetin dioxygenase-like cupin family protein
MKKKRLKKVWKKKAKNLLSMGLKFMSNSHLSFPRRRESIFKVILISSVIFFAIQKNIFSQELPKGAIQVMPENIKWIDAPPPLPPGSKVAVLEGNPKQEGIFTMRVMLPPYFKILAHTHPKDERVTVIEGTIYIGFGDKADTANATKFSAGSFYVNPADVKHYVFTGSDGCIFQVTGFGPWGLNYVEDVK